MYYYVRLLKGCPMLATIQEPFKIVFSISTDLMEHPYPEPCDLLCHAVVKSQVEGSESENDTVMTIMPQGLSQGSRLTYDPTTGYCSVDLRFAPCMTPYDECQIVLTVDRAKMANRRTVVPASMATNMVLAASQDSQQAQQEKDQGLSKDDSKLSGTVAAMNNLSLGKSSHHKEKSPSEYDILPAWSLPIALAPAPLDFKKNKGRKINRKYQVDTRQTLVERYFKLPPVTKGDGSTTTTGKSLVIREDATEGFMARHIWDSGVFMTRYLARAESWLSQHLNQNKLQRNTCIELGAGTGLVGIAVGARFPQLKVLATDLDEALELMQQNVDMNEFLLHDNVTVGMIDWAEKDRKVEPVDLLLLADVVYNDLSHNWLLQTILDYSDKDTKILLGYKFRHDTEAQFFVKAKEFFTLENVFQQDSLELFVLSRK